MWGKGTSAAFRHRLEEVCKSLDINLNSGKFTQNVAASLGAALENGKVGANDLKFVQATLDFYNNPRLDSAGNTVSLANVYDARQGATPPVPQSRPVETAAAEPAAPVHPSNAGTDVLPRQRTSDADLSGVHDAGLGLETRLLGLETRLEAATNNAPSPSAALPAGPAFPFPLNSSGLMLAEAGNASSAEVMRNGLSRLERQPVTLLNAARLYNTYHSPTMQPETGVAMERLERLGMDPQQSFDLRQPDALRNLMLTLVAYARDMTQGAFSASPQRQQWEQEIGAAIPDNRPEQAPAPVPEAVISARSPAADLRPA